MEEGNGDGRDVGKNAKQTSGIVSVTEMCVTAAGLCCVCFDSLVAQLGVVPWIRSWSNWPTGHWGKSREQDCCDSGFISK